MGVFCNLEHPTGLAEHKPFYSQDSGKGVSENVMAVVTDHRNSRQNISKLKVWGNSKDSKPLEFQAFLSSNHKHINPCFQNQSKIFLREVTARKLNNMRPNKVEIKVYLHI
jgi:hypothetical protein